MMYIIIKEGDPSKHADHEEVYKEKSTSVAEKIMDDDHFKEYVAKHGYHFSDKLAECASKKMINGDGTMHSWTATQVKNALYDLGCTDFKKCTIGDLMYLANMAYADFYPEILHNETACIKYAYAVAHDKDGYDGIAFSRWLADITKKGITDIEWEKYV